MRRVLLLLLLTSCSSDEALRIEWRFSELGTGCAEAGVQTVHVFVGPLAPTGSYDREVRCEVGGVWVHDLAPGAHTLVLKGIAHDKTRCLLVKEMSTSDQAFAYRVPCQPGDVVDVQLGH